MSSLSERVNSLGADRVPARPDHVGLTVAELSQTTEWYCKALGFAVELELRVDAIDLDIVMLKSADGFRLELLSRPGSVGTCKPANPGDAALREGFGHIAFDVSPLEETHHALLRLGAREVMAPQASPEPGVRMSFVTDPEGNLVELLERHA